MDSKIAASKLMRRLIPGLGLLESKTLAEALTHVLSPNLMAEDGKANQIAHEALQLALDSRDANAGVPYKVAVTTLADKLCLPRAVEW